MIVVSDTSPLSGLAIVGYLPLLQQLYERVLIPSAVADELIRGGEDDDRISQVLSLSWIEVRQPNDLQQVALLETDCNLDRGEAQAITLALELGADELLIDERFDCLDFTTTQPTKLSLQLPKFTAPPFSLKIKRF